jgi:hypothetical protein
MTWNPVMNGLSINFPNALAVDPNDADIAYLAADTHLYMTTNGGMMWGPIDAGLPGNVVTNIAVDGNDPAVLYAAIGASVWRSPDRGTSWHPTGTLPPGSSINDLLIDTLRPATLYLATLNGVLRSADAGGSWQPYSDGLPNAHARSLSLDRDHAALYTATDGGLAVARFVAALRLAATLNATVVVPRGGTTLAATVANDGPDDATRLVVTLASTLDVAARDASITGGTCMTTPAVSCQVDRLDAGQQATLTVDLQTGNTMGTSTLSLMATAAQDVGSGASAEVDLRVVDGPFVTTNVIHVVKHKALVPIACATTRRKVCKGRLGLSSADAKPRTLGRARFGIRRDRTVTVKVPLRRVKLHPGDQVAAELTIRAAGAKATTPVTLQKD